MGKYQTVAHGVDRRINEMIHLGMKKSEMIELIKEERLAEGYTLQEWEECKQHFIQNNEYIRSINSIEKLRQSAKPFVAWAESKNLKYEKITREHLCEYLQYRNSQNLSAWTLSSDLSFCRKIFGEHELTKKELGLPSRKISQVARAKSPELSARPRLYAKTDVQLQTMLCSATGMRRASLLAVTPSAFIRHPETNEIIRCRLLEKGGKYREAYVLPRYRTEIEKLIAGRKPDEKLFARIDKHIGYHQFRKLYANDLATQLCEERMHGRPYFRGEMDCPVKLNTHDSRHYDMHGTYHGLNIPVALRVSAALGHNRLDILRSYLNF